MILIIADYDTGYQYEAELLHVNDGRIIGYRKNSDENGWSDFLPLNSGLLDSASQISAR